MSACSPLQLSASFKRYYDQLRDPTSPTTTTPLHVSVLNRDCSRVLQLLTKQGVNPRITDQNGCTPLNHAALLGHVKICELLITAGANINAAAHDGNTPLHKAAQGGRAEVIQLLLREGAGPFAVNKKQESAYTIASHRNHVQVAILLYPYSGETRV
ncbi:Ankyrin repeat domain-containing protein 12 [Phytophthora ramorum]|uniref:Ankyrin repeat domain-containing protein 12 n=1 Tax=Phytophthora ramorum TaxID=164328 RepID=UPI0030A19C38|nr:Ankyrin repeat domain-containing protein 12 [Phytophthora ramorum]